MIFWQIFDWSSSYELPIFEVSANSRLEAGDLDFSVYASNSKTVHFPTHFKSEFEVSTMVHKTGHFHIKISKRAKIWILHSLHYILRNLKK